MFRKISILTFAMLILSSLSGTQAVASPSVESQTGAIYSQSLVFGPNVTRMASTVRVPSPPAIGTVNTSESRTLKVPFTLGSSNGSAITKVEYSINRGATWTVVTSSPVVITELRNKATYVIQMRSTNSKGASAIASKSAKPVASANPITFSQPSSMAYGASDQTVTATAPGGTTSITSITPSTCTMGGGKVHTVAVGTCKLRATNVGDDVFAASTSVTRSFGIVKANQVINFMQPSNMALTSIDQTLVASTPAGTVTFRSTTRTVCTIVGGAIHAVKIGTCTISATNSGSTRYNAASSVSRTISILTALPTPTESPTLHPCDPVIEPDGSINYCGVISPAPTPTSTPTQSPTATPTPTPTPTATNTPEPSPGPATSYKCTTVAIQECGPVTALSLLSNGTVRQVSESKAWLEPENDVTFTYTSSAADAGLQLQVNWIDLSSGLSATVDRNPMSSAWSSTACFPDGAPSQCQIRLDSSGSATFALHFTGNTTGKSFRYLIAAAGYSSATVLATFGTAPTPSATPTASTTATSTPTTAPGTWNGMTTFNIENMTNGRWADSQVYWAIIGKSWETGKFVWVDGNGGLHQMDVSDNGSLIKGGQQYTNYFHTLADSKSVTIPAINSARIMFAVGSPMYIKVLLDGNGDVGYAGANIENPSDANQDVTFDFGEMAILPADSSNPGIWINTSRVDQFGFPLKLRVQGQGGYDQTVGEDLSESRASLYSQFISQMPAQFKGLAQTSRADQRIVAPAHDSFRTGQINGNYLQPYIDQMWEKYKSEDLVFTLPNMGTFTGRVQANNTFRFTGGNQNGTYYINGKLNTSQVMLGEGLLNDAVGASHVGVQLQIQAQVCAALNRHVFEQPTRWHDAAYFYPAGGLANYYAKFWHEHSIDAKAYGFAYDDVGDWSPSLYTRAPTTVTFSIGW